MRYTAASFFVAVAQAAVPPLSFSPSPVAASSVAVSPAPAAASLSGGLSGLTSGLSGLTGALMLPGLPNFSNGNGFSSISNDLTQAAQSIGFDGNGLAVANAKLTSDVSVTLMPNIATTLDIVKSLGAASTTLWNLAYNLEVKVCAIANSINQQNIYAQTGALVAAIQGEISALVALQQTLADLIPNITAKIAAFTLAEKQILTAAVQALVAAGLSSAVPIQVLANGLITVGSSAIANAAASLTSQAQAFASYAAQVDFVPLSASTSPP